MPPPRGRLSPTFRTTDKSVPQRQNANRGPVGQQPGTGLLDQIGNTANTPLDFSGAPPIRDQNIIPPSTSPVDVPGAREATGPLQASSPVAFSGPSEMSYRGQRTDPGQQYRQQAGPGVDPSQTQQFDPNSGRYFGAPNRDFAGQGASLEQATFQRGLNRIDPYMQEQRSAMAQRLQNQGLPVGSEAYEQELDRFDRSRGDQLENLALSSVGAGRQEQGRLFGQDFASGQFNAGEARRQFGERLGATSFNAQEQGRGFRENLASNQNQFTQNLSSNQFNAGESGRNFGERFAGEAQYFGQQQARDQFAAQQAQARDQQGIQQQQFGDQFGAGQSRFADQFGAQQQQQGFNNQMANQNLLGNNDRFMAQQQSNQFNQDTQRRGISTQEMMQQRQDPYNQLNQLLGFAGQVGNPSFGQTQQFGPMGVDYMGQRNRYFQQQQQSAFDWAGLASGGAQAAITAFSDRRIKRNIKKLGEFTKGISWYAFRYIGDAKRRIGFMADEVQKAIPEAVHDVNGVLAVDYGMVFDAAR